MRSSPDEDDRLLIEEVQELDKNVLPGEFNVRTGFLVILAGIVIGIAAWALFQ